eukprot:SRR837773.1560.p2 GENE.SRR837773.1560~~SRR837773.1560.p2  ORF type:complete len:149 (+),score=47.71 SRR837773.1560:135-581(+)
MVKVWFSAPVNLRRMIVASVGAEDGAASHPSQVRMYVGSAAENLDFDSMTDVAPVQVSDVAVNFEAAEYCSCGPKNFTQVTFVLMHFPGNHGGAERTRVSYIGLQGEHSHSKRQAVDAKYELIPNADDTAAAQHALGLDKLGGLARMS